MPTHVQFTVHELPNEKLARNKWGLLMCRVNGTSPLVRVKSNAWPIPTKDLLAGSVLRGSVVERTYQGRKQLLASDVQPVDPELFHITHQLVAHDASLRRTLEVLMVKKGGMELKAVMRDPKQLQGLLKVPKERCAAMLALFDKADALAELADLESLPMPMRSVLTANDAVAVLENPYHLCVALRASTKQFKTRSVLAVAEAIAKERGHKHDDPRRLFAHLKHAIDTRSRDTGSYWLATDEIVSEASSLMQKLWPTDVTLKPALQKMLDDARFEIHGGSITTSEKAKIERSVATKLASLARLNSPAPKALHLAKAIIAGETVFPNLAASTASVASVATAAERLRSLDTTQRQAVLTTLSHPVSLLTGSAGCGKSSVLAAIEALLRSAGEPVALCAPSGKAAKRLVELTGQPASTIHSLMFKKQEPKRIVIDELSMVSPKLLQQLIGAKGSTLQMLVLCGDDHQLPSIEAGALLRDLIDAGKLPATRLTTVHRSGPGSTIVERAHAISEGNEAGIAPSEGQAWSVRHCTCEEGITHALRRVQELHAANESFVVLAQRRATCNTLNRALQRMINPPDEKTKPELPSPMGKPEHGPAPPPWRIGDRVIATATESNPNPPHEKLCTNGDMGTIVAVNATARRLSIAFDEGGECSFAASTRDLLHAYAMTIHRYQGSESDHAIVVMDLCTKHQSREALYTAVTRGAKTVAIVGSSTMLRAAIRRSTRAERRTMLCERLGRAFAKRSRHE